MSDDERRDGPAAAEAAGAAEGEEAPRTGQSV